MSSSRWRNAGTCTVTTERRKNRSWRNAPLLHLLLEVAVGRGDDAHVDGDLLLPADRLDAALLERAQQLRLQIDRQLADLVEEQRAAVGALERALAIRVGAGERAFDVTEQLRLDQVAAPPPRSRTRRTAPWPAATPCGWRARSRPCPLPVSPPMSTVRSVARDALEHTEHLAHAHRAADDVAERMVRADGDLLRRGLRRRGSGSWSRRR